MNVPRLFRITSLFVFLQIALGGVVTFGLDPFKVGSFDPVLLAHIANGIIVFGLVVVVAVSALASKPKHNGLNQVSLAMVVFVVVQLALGTTMVAVIDAGVLGWIHLLLAVLIYAMTLVGRSFAMMRDQAAGIGIPTQTK
ncbi:MAG: hypothetical protein JRN20_00875 [Nitrososphaerota archaeon]|nr:hypothetical protein [Nitrososphaerota archaeon]